MVGKRERDIAINIVRIVDAMAFRMYVVIVVRISIYIYIHLPCTVGDILENTKQIQNVWELGHSTCFGDSKQTYATVFLIMKKNYLK